MQHLLGKFKTLHTSPCSSGATMLQQATNTLDDDDTCLVENPLFQVTESDVEDAYEDFHIIEADSVSDNVEDIDVELWINLSVADVNFRFNKNFKKLCVFVLYFFAHHEINVAL